MNREGVGATVANVKPCGVTPLAKTSKRITSQGNLISIHRHLLDAGLVHQQVELARTRRTFANLEHDRGFEDGERRDQALRIRCDRARELLGLRLTEENGNNSRRID